MCRQLSRITRINENQKNRILSKGHRKLLVLNPKEIEIQQLPHKKKFVFSKKIYPQIKILRDIYIYIYIRDWIKFNGIMGHPAGSVVKHVTLNLRVGNQAPSGCGDYLKIKIIKK